MSQIEKDIASKIAGMPQSLQDKFLSQIQGAVLAMDALAMDQATSAANEKIREEAGT